MFGKKEKAKAAWVQTALDRYERPLLQYAISIVHSLDRARDVVQETFMRLHKLGFSRSPSRTKSPSAEAPSNRICGC